MERNSTLYNRLKPHILRNQGVSRRIAVAGSSSGGAVAAHNLNDSNIHLGPLDPSQAPWVAENLATHASNPNAHHNKSHVLATTSALGPDHTVSGLTVGQVLQAATGTTAKFALLAHSSLTGVTENQHHNRQHNITNASDHTITASQYDVVGATADNTIGILSSSNDPGAAVRLLRSTSGGALTLESFTSNGDIYGSNTAFRAIYHTHGGVDHVHLVINPTGSWTLDEQFGVDIDDNLLVRGWIVGKHALQIPDATFIAHFDGSEPFESNHTGEATGNKGQVPTFTGPPIFVAGKFDKCIQISEVGQNLVPQPSFEGATDAIGLTNNWSIFNDTGGDLAAARDITASVYGDYSAKLTAGTINNSQFYASFGSATSGQPYTASVWLKASVPMNVTLRMRQHTSPYTSWGTTTCAVTTTWQRFQLTVTAPSTVGGRISIEPQAAGSVWVDAVQVENKSYATHYIDGSLGDAFTWDGTEWNSTSSRVKTTLRYEANEAVNPVQGSVSMWFRVPYTALNTDLRSNCRMFEYGHYTSPVSSTWIAMVTDDDHSSMIFYYYNGSTGVSRTYTSFGSNCCDGEWHLATMTWGDGYLSSYMDGALISNDAITVTQTPSDQTYIGVGNNRLATENFPSIDIDDFMIVNRVLDADEVRAIYESNAPVFAESSTWHWRAGQNLLWADAEGLWMFNADGEAVLGAYGGDGDGGTKTWGGRTLETSDVLIGDESRGGYLHWDDSAATLLVSGQIEVLAGSSGIASFGDAGSLATADNLDDVADGSTYAKLRKTIIGGGYILVGSGTKDSTLNGWLIDSTEIVGQASGADQVILSASDGSIRLHGTDVIFNVDGINAKADTAPLSNIARAVSWWTDPTDRTGNPEGSIYNWLDASVFLRQNTVLAAHGNSSYTAAAVWLSATGNAGGEGYFFVSADGGTFYLDTNADFLLNPNTPTLGSNWSNHSGASLVTRYFANMVEMYGALDAGASPSTTLLTLGSALRPSAAHYATVLQVNGGFTAAQLVKINTTGTVVATGWTPANGDVVYFQIVYFL